MVKNIFFIILISIVFFKNYALASNNLFFSTAQFLTYCQSNNNYELGICDGYIISVNDSQFSQNNPRPARKDASSDWGTAIDASHA